MSESNKKKNQEGSITPIGPRIIIRMSEIASAVNSFGEQYEKIAGPLQHANVPTEIISIRKQYETIITPFRVAEVAITLASLGKQFETTLPANKFAKIASEVIELAKQRESILGPKYNAEFASAISSIGKQYNAIMVSFEIENLVANLPLIKGENFDMLKSHSNLENMNVNLKLMNQQYDHLIQKNEVFKFNVVKLINSPIIEELQRIRENLLFSSGIYELFSASERFLNVDNISDEIQFEINKKINKFDDGFNIEKDLRKYLNQIDSNFINLLDGAWQAFNSDNPDKYRQAVTSHRELFTQFIHKLAPNEEILKLEKYSQLKPKDITRKIRIRFIVSSEQIRNEILIKFIDSIATEIDVLYSLLSKVTHTNYCNHNSIYCFMKSLENALYLLIHNRIKN